MPLVSELVGVTTGEIVVGREVSVVIEMLEGSSLSAGVTSTNVVVVRGATDVVSRTITGTAVLKSASS